MVKKIVKKIVKKEVVKPVTEPVKTIVKSIDADKILVKNKTDGVISLGLDENKALLYFRAKEVKAVKPSPLVSQYIEDGFLEIVKK